MTDTLRAQVAAALDLERERRGWTQERLALEAGFTPKHVSQMLTGRAAGSFVAWQTLADALGMEFFVGLVPRG